jgi:hypothetical protein
MGILRWPLGSQGRFVGTNTAFVAAVAGVALLGRKFLTGEFGSPDFVAVMVSVPLSTLLGSIVMWKLFFKSNPFAKAKRG